MSVKKATRTIKRGHYNGYDYGEMRTFKGETTISASYFVVLKNRKPLNAEKFNSVSAVKKWIDENPR